MSSAGTKRAVVRLAFERFGLSAGQWHDLTAAGGATESGAAYDINMAGLVETNRGGVSQDDQQALSAALAEGLAFLGAGSVAELNEMLANASAEAREATLAWLFTYMVSRN